MGKLERHEIEFDREELEQIVTEYLQECGYSKLSSVTWSMTAAEGTASLCLAIQGTIPHDRADCLRRHADQAAKRVKLAKPKKQGKPLIDLL